MNGYMGKILVVDLTNGEIKDEPLNEDYVQRFIGGSGLACRYLYDMLDADTDPLGPQNALLFMAGPLAGTTAPSCSRYVICGRSPLTGLWGEANSGGFFGPEMRFAGYDGILIQGRSPEPVYLHIEDGAAELRDATKLWGEGSYKTQQLIKQELDDKKVRIACIGPAGENCVKFAAVMNDDGSAAARTGMGAVMGSKQLKAVAVRGHGKAPLADPERFAVLAREALADIKEDITADILRETGSAGTLDYSMMLGDAPAGYFNQGSFEGGGKLSGSVMAETILSGPFACYGCPIACKRRVTVDKYGLNKTKGPEYETVCALGTMLLIDDLPAVTYLGHLCDDYGMDTISTGSTIAFAYHLFEQGVIGTQETGGIELRSGDPDLAIQLIEMIAQRQGFGDVLAEGSRLAGRKYGCEDQAVQVKGMEVAMHDPRAMSSMALVYATSPIGGSHNQSDMYFVELGRSMEELGIVSEDRFAEEGKARMVARHQDFRSFCNALIICYFANPQAQTMVDLLSSATGREISIDDAMAAGERIWNLKRALNIRLGQTRKDDRLPKPLLVPLKEGGTEGHVPNLDAMLAEYYQARGWNPKTGEPKKEKMLALGLGDII